MTNRAKKLIRLAQQKPKSLDDIQISEQEAMSAAKKILIKHARLMELLKDA